MKQPFEKCLAASFGLNVIALCLVGYAHAHAAKEPTQAHAVVKPSRLIEIKQLDAPKTSSTAAGKQGGGDGGSEDEDADGSNGDKDDSSAEPPVAVGSRPKPLSAKSGARSSAKPLAATRPNLRADIHSKLTANLGSIHVQPPKPGVAGGLHGVMDLSKAHITLAMHADGKLPPGASKPNKFIGKSQVQIIGKSSSTVKCVGSVGGNTVYASDIKIILGKGIKITGTKYCAPGSGLGFGGSSSDRNQPHTGVQTQLGIQSGSGGDGHSEAHGYRGGAIAQHAPAGEGRNAFQARQDAGPGAAPSRGSDQRSGASGGGESKGKALGNGSGGDGQSDDTSTVSQEGLERNYEAYASGAVHPVDDEKGVAMFQGVEPGAPVRQPHLPESHGDPIDRVRLGGSSGGVKNGAPNGQTGTKPLAFVASPDSVGSHSDQGTVPWAPDTPKKNKRLKGLLGEYFLGSDFQQEMCTRRDANIDFTWTGLVVDPRLPTGHPFSVRWTGSIRPKYSETYTFYTTSDDGVRLWVSGQMLISNWTIHAASEDVARVTLQAGKEYPIRLEYFEKNGMSNEIIKFYWESPSQPKEYVPQKCLLYPGASGP